MDRRFRLIAFVGAVLVAVMVGFVSYNAGVSHGLAVSASAPAAAPGVPVQPYGPYGWYRPWGFGLFAPFLFLFFWLFLFRAFFWGGFGGRRWCRPGPYGAAPDFDEWHRRAHERMKG
jgi:hypothetical protein